MLNEMGYSPKKYVRFLFNLPLNSTIRKLSLHWEMRKPVELSVLLRTPGLTIVELVDLQRSTISYLRPTAQRSRDPARYIYRGRYLQ